jgi:uncharacterized membrane protein
LNRTRFRTEMLLAVGCFAAAVLLGASELMDTFHLTPPGGEALQASQAIDRHHGAILVLAVAAIVALAVAVMTGSKPAAVAVAVCGVIALLIFLVNDLPDANKIGTLDDARESFVDAKAMPQEGFWFMLAGALLLSLCGTALATMPSYRIKLFGPPGEAEKPKVVDWSKST